MTSHICTVLLTPRCRFRVALSLVQTNTDLPREERGAAAATSNEKFIRRCYLDTIQRAQSSKTRTNYSVKLNCLDATHAF